MIDLSYWVLKHSAQGFVGLIQMMDSLKPSLRTQICHLFQISYLSFLWKLVKVTEVTWEV